MKRFFFPLASFAALAAAALGTLPAQAHGSAAGGALAGLAHPLMGADHLLMLLALGTAASQLTFPVFPWALGGALVGALWSLSGWTVPLLETLAALSIMAVATLPLIRSRGGALPTTSQLTGGVVGAGVAIHSLLHGLEAPADGSALLWWGGALLSSLVIGGGTVLLLRGLPRGWGRWLALALFIGGGVCVFAS
jgi:urease accessory protein